MNLWHIPSERLEPLIGFTIIAIFLEKGYRVWVRIWAKEPKADGSSEETVSFFLEVEGDR